MVGHVQPCKTLAAAVERGAAAGCALVATTFPRVVNRQRRHLPSRRKSLEAAENQTARLHSARSKIALLAASPLNETMFNQAILLKKITTNHESKVKSDDATPNADSNTRSLCDAAKEGPARKSASAVDNSDGASRASKRAGQYKAVF